MRGMVGHYNVHAMYRLRQPALRTLPITEGNLYRESEGMNNWVINPNTASWVQGPKNDALRNQEPSTFDQ